MFSEFFSDTQNAHIATLLIMAPLTTDEKHGWIEMLPFMNANEKDELKANLEADVDDYNKLEEMTVAEMNRRLEEIYKS